MTPAEASVVLRVRARAVPRQIRLSLVAFMTYFLTKAFHIPLIRT
jgi:hypothetical protein